LLPNVPITIGIATAQTMTRIRVSIMLLIIHGRHVNSMHTNALLSNYLALLSKGIKYIS
jgi:hypothetical protein